MNTASAIRSAVAGRSERLQHRLYSATGLGEVFNDSNVHLSVKSSPEKTAPALSPLAEKEGTVVKLNDSGSWRRRRALLVPHTFLYYFAESTAETDLRPHGVIDLLLYTDVEVVDGAVVKLAPGDEMSPARTFYLRMANREEAESWAQAIRETRFDCVRGERDALRTAKECLTEQLVSQAEELRECRASLAASRRRESAAVSEVARRNADEARRVEQVRALLQASASATASGSTSPSRYGRPPDVDSNGGGSSGGERRRGSSAEAGASAAGVGGGERSSRNGGSRCVGSGGTARGEGPESEAGEGERASMAMGGVGGRSSVAATALSELAALEEAIAERAQEVASLKMENTALRERETLAAERHRGEVKDALRLRAEERQRADEEAALRSDLEAELQHLRAQLAESRAGWEEARTNLGVVAAACREADAKSRELQEHRRVLAREVKASRAEQRRLSAALSCATTAAATAAARAAAARAEAKAATAAAAAAERANSAERRSASAASWAAGDASAARETETSGRGHDREGRETREARQGGGEGAGGGGGREGDAYAEELAGGGLEVLPLPPPCLGVQGEDAREEEAQATPSETAVPGDDGDSVHGGSRTGRAFGPVGPSSTAAIVAKDVGEPGCGAGCDDGAGTAVAARESAVSLWVRPSSPEAAPGALQQQQQQEGGVCEEAFVEGSDECSATCYLETESPGASGGVVGESGSLGGWADADDQRGVEGKQGQQQAPSSCSSSGRSSPTDGEGGAAQRRKGHSRASSTDTPSATEEPSANAEVFVADTGSRGTRRGRGGGGNEDGEGTFANAREEGFGDCAEVGDQQGNMAEEGNAPPPRLSPPRGDHQPEPSIAGEDDNSGSSSSGGSSGSSQGGAALPPASRVAAEAPASPTTSLAAAFGESSSLRFNQMVQSLSAGLRESRKARRTPLLGSLDDDDDGDNGGGGGDMCAVEVDPEEDDGGVTDGTGTDGGDSHHDSIATTTTAAAAAAAATTAAAVTSMARKDSGRAWSAWSTVGGGGGGGGGGRSRSRGSSCHEPPATLADEGDQEQQSGGVVVGAVANGGEQEDESPCATIDGHDDFDCVPSPSPPITTPTAARSVSGLTEAEFAPPPTPPCSPSVAFPTSATSAAAAADAVGMAAVKKTSEWLRVLGRPDGEDEGLETLEQGSSQVQQRQESAVLGLPSVSSPPPKEEAEGRGDVDGGVGRCDDRVDGDFLPSAAPPSASSAVSAVDAGVDADGGVGGVAVAVALAAAERGGRASAEAAAAARRWEAKLKGSLVSMAGGVRWGMGPQRITDANFFKS